MAILERDYRIDGIKWLLIVLVTFGKQSKNGY